MVETRTSCELFDDENCDSHRGTGLVFIPMYAVVSVCLLIPVCPKFHSTTRWTGRPFSDGTWFQMSGNSTPEVNIHATPRH